MKTTYIYPENLKAKPTMWVWELRDVLVIGTLCLLAVLVLAAAGSVLVFSIAAGYAFLTMRAGETSTLDFMVYCFRYFLVKQQYFIWSSEKLSDR